MRHASPRLIALSLCAAILLASVLPTSAQFFQQFFTGGGDGQVREQEAPPTGDANWFEARVEADKLPCSLARLRHAQPPAHPSSALAPFPAFPRPPTVHAPSHNKFAALIQTRRAARWTLADTFALESNVQHPAEITAAMGPPRRHRGGASKTKAGTPRSSHQQAPAVASSSLSPLSSSPLQTGNELFALRGHGTPLLTLVFQDASHQRAALARMEAFYEGAGAPKGVYLDLEEASNARLCRNYQAFNLPLDSVRQWLAAMRRHHGECEAQHADPSETSEGASSSTSEMSWWESHCNPTECAVLRQLHSLEALAEQSNSPFRYLVSVLQQFAASSLTHEQNHALFHLVPSFASAAQRAWDDLPRKAKSIIQHDLQLRGYAESVWVDEFQAYVAEDPSEFGNVAAEACAEARDRLQQERKQGWQALGLGS
ncbi:hypothetical protein CBOM_03251 [Ceraceosorus bombacis]|uniref:Uncharacterized protein n=1 Tax=Ceraceosorus bombacis TaxID=401625 RepID=A0A0P1BMK1_9BASI|nr:hypothetical protein CBOM_03251 [Ceraceosorus bombacis]